MDITARRRRKNLQTLFDNTSIVPFDWDNSYSCFYCKRRVANYDGLRKHTKSHGKFSEGHKKLRTNKLSVKIDVSELTCDLCQQSFQSLDDLVMHLPSHGLKYNRHIDNNIDQYKLADLSCLSCQEKFTDFSHLLSHSTEIHPKTLYCDICPETFNLKSDLEFHLINKHKDRTRECCTCNKQFTSIDLYEKHIKKCFVKIEPKREIVKKEKKQNLREIRDNIASFLNMTTALPFKFFMQRFRCFYCTEDFTDFEPLKLHTVTQHTYCDPKSKLMKSFKGNYINVKLDIHSMSCKLCCETADSLQSMIDHLTRNHQAKFDKNFVSLLQPFRLIKDNMACLICINVSFRYFSKLLEHMNELHSNNKIICSFCGMTFGKDPNYRSHLKRHHNPGCSKCPDCDLDFDNISKLINHRAKAHGEKTFKCPKCFETFGTQYKRQKHLIDAHGSGHPCNYCGKLFTRNSFMKDHIRRSHLKEKNAECSVCKEKFFDNILLRIHMVKHVGERNFHCDVCGKTFLWKKNLRGHMASHK